MADGRLGQEEDREGVEEREGAAERRGRESAAREGVDQRDSGGGAGEGREGDGSKRGREEDEPEPQRGCSEQRTRMVGQRGSGRGESGTGGNP